VPTAPLVFIVVRWTYQAPVYYAYLHRLLQTRERALGAGSYLENFEGVLGRSDGEQEGRTSPQTENIESQSLQMSISTLSSGPQ